MTTNNKGLSPEMKPAFEIFKKTRPTEVQGFSSMQKEKIEAENQKIKSFYDSFNFETLKDSIKAEIMPNIFDT